MKFDYKKYIKHTKPYIYTYRYGLIGMIVLGVFGYVIFQIDSLTNIERDENRYEKEVGEIKKIEFNEEAIVTIEQLRDLNVEVNPSFDQNRTNPFED